MTENFNLVIPTYPLLQYNDGRRYFIVRKQIIGESGRDRYMKERKRERERCKFKKPKRNIKVGLLFPH